MNFTHLSELDPAGLEKLAVLHQSVMPTLLTDLGAPFVQRYYQVCREDAAVIGLCALSPLPKGEEPGMREKVLGWAVGSPHPDVLNARLRQPFPWFARQMLRLGFTRPGVLWQLANSALSSPSQMESEPGAIELTYIGVAPSARGQGLGTDLLKAFAEAARSAGYHSVVLSVETENPEAASIYHHTGFQIMKTFDEGRYQRHRMKLVL